MYREGKELRLAFDEEQLLGIHLMLHGKLVFTDDAAEEKHTIFSLSFEDGSRLSLTDYRGIANPTLNPPRAKPRTPCQRSSHKPTWRKH
ncbi:hypothetical protein MKQ70_31950 [Chitinophaga sedimenti]|nr:DNA-formamidopyrimidine glycosylase family protein [Chitinophaga sedimenti]MCK7559332.1 hypothetical protein [Chitinophaga sedimenti]